MMNKRRSFLLAASFALGVVLLALLMRISRIDLRLTLQQLESVRWISFAKVVLLNALLVLASTEKWRSIDTTLRSSTDSLQPRSASFALTSVGLALGTLLPLQVAMATARTLGTYVHGSPIKRGTAGTFYEQSFDILAVCFLAVASVITRVFSGGETLWIISAAILTGLALLTVQPLMRVIQWFADTCRIKVASSENRLGVALRDFLEFQHSALFNVGLARRLVVLSLARYVVIVLMSIQTAEAIGLHIPLWQMAAAIPFVVIASVIALTPGGLGINELTAATALIFFGTQLAVGSQWILANRVLVTVSYWVVAICAATIFSVGKIKTSSSRTAVQDH